MTQPLNLDFDGTGTHNQVLQTFIDNGRVTMDYENMSATISRETDQASDPFASLMEARDIMGLRARLAEVGFTVVDVD